MRGGTRGSRSSCRAASTCSGPYNDDPLRASATGTKHVSLEHRNFGEFKTPSLRKLALTAPYMHNGRLATLRDVVDHYSNISPDRLHSDGEAILKPLKLSEQEARDLVAFLESLQDGGGNYKRKALAARLSLSALSPACLAVRRP